MPGSWTASKWCLSAMIRRGLQVLKELLFPQFCLVCKTEGSLWCAGCIAKNPSAYFSFVPISVAEGTAPALERVTALCFYEQSPVIRQCIRLLKYNFQTDHRDMWEKLLAFPDLAKDFVIVPVPLYTRRERERGFNQAEYIAAVIAANHGLEILTQRLVRTRSTKQQARLSRNKRLENVAAAFEWRDGSPPPSVYLVDDVYTTGATMQECAEALKMAGVERVEGLVVAHG